MPKYPDPNYNHHRPSFSEADTLHTPFSKNYTIQRPGTHRSGPNIAVKYIKFSNIDQRRRYRYIVAKFQSFFPKFKKQNRRISRNVWQRLSPFFKRSQRSFLLKKPSFFPILQVFKLCQKSKYWSHLLYYFRRKHCQISPKEKDINNEKTQSHNFYKILYLFDKKNINELFPYRPFDYKIDLISDITTSNQKNRPFFQKELQIIQTWFFENLDKDWI